VLTALGRFTPENKPFDIDDFLTYPSDSDSDYAHPVEGEAKLGKMSKAQKRRVRKSRRGPT
jgi:hypothetical protein